MTHFSNSFVRVMFDDSYLALIVFSFFQLATSYLVLIVHSASGFTFLTSYQVADLLQLSDCKVTLQSYLLQRLRSGRYLPADTGGNRISNGSPATSGLAGAPF
jgi:hypothetical protein